MPRRLVALAAACLLFAVACGDDGPPPGQTKVRLFPPNLCCHGAELEPDTYTSPTWFAPKLVLDVPAGWRSVAVDDVHLFALGQGRNDLDDMSRNVYFFAVPPSHTQLLIELPRMLGVKASGRSVAATVAGLPARRLDVTVEPNPGVKEDRTLGIPAHSRALPVLDKYLAAGEFHMITATAGPKVRFYVVPVRTLLLLVMVEAPPKEFDAFAKEADALLATLKFPA